MQTPEVEALDFLAVGFEGVYLARAEVRREPGLHGLIVIRGIERVGRRWAKRPRAAIHCVRYTKHLKRNNPITGHQLSRGVRCNPGAWRHHKLQRVRGLNQGLGQFAEPLARLPFWANGQQRAQGFLMVTYPGHQPLSARRPKPMDLLVPVATLQCNPRHHLAKRSDPMCRKGFAQLGRQPVRGQRLWGRAHRQVQLQHVDGCNATLDLL